MPFEIPEPLGQVIFAIIAIGLSALVVAFLVGLVVTVIAMIVAFIGTPDDAFDIEINSAVESRSKTSHDKATRNTNPRRNKLR